MSDVQQVGGPQAVWPERPQPNLPSYDARGAALKQFRAFLHELVFERAAGPGNPSVKFQVPLSSIHISQPDDGKPAAMPGFGIVPSQGVSESFGLGPADVDDESFERFAPGTALLVESDYTEDFVLECWGSKQAERRALVAGVKTAMRRNQDSYALRLRLPNYFDQVASFELLDTLYVDGDEVARNRRRALVTIRLNVAEVSLINMVRMREPELLLCVSDSSPLVTLGCTPVDSGRACSC